MSKAPKIGENVLFILGPTLVGVGPITDILPDGRVLVASILKQPVRVWLAPEGEEWQWEEQPEDLIPSTGAWMPDRVPDGGPAMIIKDDVPDFDPS